MAKLYFRYGAMNSGKTLDIIKTDRNYKEKNMNTLVIKAILDKKGDDNIISRVGFERKVDLLVSDKDNIKDLIIDYLNKEVISCILVDEAQFLSSKQIDELSDIVDFYKIPVICYGLRTDFQSNLFPGSKRLMELADSLEEIKTICRCGTKAIMNTRKNKDEYIFEGKQIAIDGIDASYESLCRKCYKEEYARYKRIHNEK